VKKCLISFLEVEVLITVQGNGRIYLSARWNLSAYFWYSILGGYWGTSPIDYTYCFLASNGLCSIGSNRNRSTTTTTKSINAEETVRQASRASATNEDHNFVS